MNSIFGRASRLSVSLSVVTSAAIAALVGCTHADDGTGSSDSFDTVTPTGTDSPATLVIHAPPGVPADALQYLLVDGHPATLDTPITKLAVGEHEISASGAIDLVTLGPNETAVYELAAVELVMPAEPTFGVDGPGQNRVRLAGPRGGYTAFEAPQVGTLRVVPHGQIVASFGFGDGVGVNALPRVVTRLDLGSRAGRRLARLVAPKRALPSTVVESIAGNRMFLHAPGAASEITLADGKTLLVGVFGDSVRPESITVQLNDQSGAALGFGAAGQDPVVSAVGRIDVTDVVVKAPDGSTTSVPGAFRLERYTGTELNNVFVGISDNVFLPTNAGADVWPGRYRLTTTYATAEAGPKTDVQDVTIH